MRKIQCGECHKIYDFDIDDFCPKCGAFNQPSRQQTAGVAIRRDGISENNHRGSFVHAELHRENWKRRGTPLAQTTRRESPFGKKELNVGRIVWWFFLGVLGLNLLSVIFS